MIQMIAWAHGNGHAGVGGALVLLATVLLVAAMLGSMAHERD
jgi:hypothetical protein